MAIIRTWLLCSSWSIRASIPVLICSIFSSVLSNLWLVSVIFFSASSLYSSTPVSYTHLDVYKRQVLSSTLFHGSVVQTIPSLIVYSFQNYCSPTLLELSYAIKVVRNVFRYRRLKFSVSLWSRRKFLPVKIYSTLYVFTVS